MKCEFIRRNPYPDFTVSGLIGQIHRHIVELPGIADCRNNLIFY
jgi:hypothetical protein